MKSGVATEALNTPPGCRCHGIFKLFHIDHAALYVRKIWGFPLKLWDTGMFLWYNIETNGDCDGVSSFITCCSQPNITVCI